MRDWATIDLNHIDNLRVKRLPKKGNRVGRGLPSALLEIGKKNARSDDTICPRAFFLLLRNKEEWQSFSLHNTLYKIH